MKEMFFGLVIILGLSSLWDGFTTVYGTYNILNGASTDFSFLRLFISIGIGLLVTGLLMATAIVWDSELDDEFLGILVRFFWFISIIYDFFTSFIGNKGFILNSDIHEPMQFVILVGITLIVSGAPILFSYLILKLTVD